MTPPASAAQPRYLLTENHRRLILESLPPAGMLLEWGIGWSTTWFLERLLPWQNLISVEHEAHWANQIRTHVLSRTLEFLPDHWKTIVSDHAREAALVNATPMEECPAELLGYIHPAGVDLATVDVFLIDGVARGACLANVLLNAKAGAVAFIHDYHRRWYDWAIDAGRRRIA